MTTVNPRSPIPGWNPPGPLELRSILRTTRRIAIVGASSNRARPSYFVATYLLGFSEKYDVYFVNPRETKIFDHPCYPSLQALPVKPDLVDVFRREDDIPGVAWESVAEGAKTLWIQLGLWSPEAARVATEHGINVVMDRCLKIEHARFSGGLHLAGFDTGIISAKRQHI